MLRLPSLLTVALFAALAAVPCAHALGGLQDPSATSHIRQAHPDDSFTVGNAVVIGEANAEVQAAFDRDTSASASSAFRKLLHGSHGHHGPVRPKLPTCPRCRIMSCSHKLKRNCRGHCVRPLKGKPGKPKVFNCRFKPSPKKKSKK